MIWFVLFFLFKICFFVTIRNINRNELQQSSDWIHGN